MLNATIFFRFVMSLRTKFSLFPFSFFCSSIKKKQKGEKNMDSGWNVKKKKNKQENVPFFFNHPVNITGLTTAVLRYTKLANINK